MAFTRGSRRILWKGLGSPRDDIREPTARAVAAAPDQPLLDRLLRQFDDIFAEPCGLPPTRPYDHCIHLLPGTPSPFGHTATRSSRRMSWSASARPC